MYFRMVLFLHHLQPFEHHQLPFEPFLEGKDFLRNYSLGVKSVKNYQCIFEWFLLCIICNLLCIISYLLCHCCCFFCFGYGLLWKEKFHNFEKFRKIEYGLKGTIELLKIFFQNSQYLLQIVAIQLILIEKVNFIPNES